MSYLRPASYRISDDFQDHQNRNSTEPGTDYATPYGTDLVAAGDGTVSIVDNNKGGGAGRRVTIDLHDGRRVSYLHLSSIGVRVGQKVKRGQVFGKSGASGFGRNWYYGPHVHVSLWQRPGMSYADTIDFEPFTVKPPAAKPVKEKDNDMAIAIMQRKNSNLTKSLYDVEKGRAIRAISTNENSSFRRASKAAVVYITVSDAEYRERGGK